MNAREHVSPAKRSREPAEIVLEAALRKHGREGLLLRSRACAGLLFAFLYSLLEVEHCTPPFLS